MAKLILALLGFIISTSAFAMGARPKHTGMIDVSSYQGRVGRLTSAVPALYGQVGAPCTVATLPDSNPVFTSPSEVGIQLRPDLWAEAFRTNVAYAKFQKKTELKLVQEFKDDPDGAARMRCGDWGDLIPHNLKHVLILRANSVEITTTYGCAFPHMGTRRETSVCEFL